ncbi:MAG: AbrB/MazE/SpoVT family DNA-binding domain-containing protein [Spirochaetales bacterium]|jgi:AbrB family looped-hinge helix DNA binding protein|nr:AbrB/MazE/SpoVT family DNA-binding domain-containing protein [Spirochaetales bacterium]
MKITTKGQITIPKNLRDEYGLLPDTDVTFEATERGVLLRPARDRSEELKRRLEQAAGAATVPITTDEILALTRGDE